MTMVGKKAIRGELLYFTGDPFVMPLERAMVYEADGGLLIEDGLIKSAGPWASLKNSLTEDICVTHYKNNLIMPGFVDSHTHYVQTEMIASFGAQLIDWLNDYTFVSEQDFQNKAHADRVADLFCDILLNNGTTTASVFCATYPASVEALFEQAEKRNMRLLAGKVMMDRNAPKALLDTARSGYDQSRSLIEKWQGKGRLGYSITPRFAPTSSPEQLEMAGSLKAEFPDVHLQSHISENKEEIDWVKALFPECKDYLDVYDRFGLLGERTILAHGIHLEERALRRLSESGTALCHCPTSNLFLGSGLFDLSMSRHKDHAIALALGSDVGGGTSFSMLKTMAEAYKVSQLCGNILTGPQAFYLATLGGARALGLDDKIGSFEVGREADFIVLSLDNSPLMTQRMKRAEDISDKLFALMILGDDRNIRATYVMGEKVY